jgi:hypothetical protein
MAHVRLRTANVVKIIQKLLIWICIAIGVALAAVVFWFFFASLRLSSPGEKSGALGNVVGGIIGALGAALSFPIAAGSATPRRLPIVGTLTQV